MLINGQAYTLTKTMSLQELLQEQGYRNNLVAVELNGAIVRRTEYGSTMLTAADRLEIVSFVGGG
ncbi:MAG: sulfur carrier protein ThiS [Phascolarctobacterium sp.]